MRDLPDSPDVNACNCTQCKELRVFEHMKRYYDDPKNPPLHSTEFYTYFWGVLRVREGSIAATLINKTFVICNDGFIRTR